MEFISGRREGKRTESLPVRALCGSTQVQPKLSISVCPLDFQMHSEYMKNPLKGTNDGEKETAI